MMLCIYLGLYVDFFIYKLQSIKFHYFSQEQNCVYLECFRFVQIPLNKKVIKKAVAKHKMFFSLIPISKVYNYSKSKFMSHKTKFYGRISVVWHLKIAAVFTGYKKCAIRKQ